MPDRVCSPAGSLSIQDIKKLLGSQASEAEVDAMMGRFDPDGDGSVTFDEYLQALCSNVPS